MKYMDGGPREPDFDPEGDGCFLTIGLYIIVALTAGSLGFYLGWLAHGR